jgi:hypothetical protein
MPERSGTPAALARSAAALGRAAVLAGATVMLALVTAAPAHAAEVFIEVNPSTVEAGNQIGIRASCPDNNAAAIVRSDAFGQVTVSPQYGFLTATIRVPADREARTYAVRLTCAEGSEAVVNLYVVNKNRPTQGPATGFGGMAGRDSGTLLIGVGLAAIIVGAGLGLITLRRRRTS